MWFLLCIGAALSADMPTKLPPDRVRGRDLYDIHCWACHGRMALGEGPSAGLLGGSAPALAGRGSPAEREAWIDLMATGKGAMPGFLAVLDREDSRRILLWLEGLDPATGDDPDGNRIRRVGAAAPATPVPEDDEAGGGD